MDEAIGLPVMAMRRQYADELQALAVQLREPACDYHRLCEEMEFVAERMMALDAVLFEVVHYAAVEVIGAGN